MTGGRNLVVKDGSKGYFTLRSEFGVIERGWDIPHVLEGAGICTQ